VGEKLKKKKAGGARIVYSQTKEGLIGCCEKGRGLKKFTGGFGCIL